MDEKKSSRLYFLFGSVLMLLSVGLGALGAHWVKHRLPASLDVFKTATHYQAMHGLALLILGCVCHLGYIAKPRLLLALFLAGIVLFSGSLYLYVATSIKIFAHITPFGGLTLMVSWLVLSIGLIRGLNKGLSTGDKQDVRKT